jgi:hypothetical protein
MLKESTKSHEEHEVFLHFTQYVLRKGFSC